MGVLLWSVKASESGDDNLVFGI